MRAYTVAFATLIVGGCFGLLIAAPGLPLLVGLAGIVAAFALIFWAFVLAPESGDRPRSSRGRRRRRGTRLHD